jgi:hypothetical protein
LKKFLYYKLINYCSNFESLFNNKLKPRIPPKISPATVQKMSAIFLPLYKYEITQTTKTRKMFNEMQTQAKLDLIIMRCYGNVYTGDDK